MRIQLDTKANALVDKSGTDNPPGKDTAGEKGDGGVKANQDTDSDESRCPFNKPAPVLDVDGGVVVFAPDEEPSEYMPVPQYTSRILGHDTE